MNPLALFIILLFFLTLTPYILYGSGQLLYFLFAFHQKDPSFLARDWLVTETANPHPFFGSFIVFLQSLGNLPLSLFLIHVIQSIFLIFGIFYLARAFSKDFRVGLLVCCLFLFYFSDGLGQETLYSAIVQPADLGKLFYLFSLGALFRGQILRSWAFLGLTGLFDFLSGVEGFLILSIFWLLRGRQWNLKSMVLGFVLFLLFFSPSLVPILNNFSLTDSFHSQEVFKLLFNFRGPHHYRISTFELAHIFRVLFPLNFLFIKMDSEEDKSRADARVYVAALLLFCALAVLSIEWFDLLALTQFRFLRLSPFLLLAGLVFLSLTFVQELERRDFLGITLSAVTLAVLFLEKDSRLFVPLALYLALAWALRSKISTETLSPSQKTVALLVCLTLPASVYLARGRAGELLLDFFLSVSLLLLLKKRWERIAPQSLLALLVIGLPAIFLGWAFPQRVSFRPIEVVPRPLLLQQNSNLDKTFEWIRTETPKDAVFLTPPYQDGIRFFAERAIVADFHANPYPATEVSEWKERLEAIGQTTSLEKWVPRGSDTTPQRELLKKGYLNLSAVQVEQIARRYGVGFFMTESSYSGKQLLIQRGHRLVYENSSYLVFQLS